MTQEETRQAAVDSLRVLLKQERHYMCPDYLAHETRPNASTDLVHSLLEEISSLVTDPSVAAVSPPPSPPRSRSPSAVTKSPSQDSLREVAKHVDPPVAAEDQSFSFWRRQMFQWTCTVVDGFSLDRQVIPVAFNMLDRYIALQDKRAVTRDDFQLYSMTSLYMATKILEPCPLRIGLDALVEMSRGCYSVHDITQTERDMLAQLEWRVNPPTAAAFCDLIWSLFPVAPTWQMTSTCEHLLEAAIADPFFLSCPSSLVGLAAVLFAAFLHGSSEEAATELLTSRLEGLISCRNNPELYRIYHELEKVYCQ